MINWEKGKKKERSNEQILTKNNDSINFKPLKEILLKFRILIKNNDSINFHPFYENFVTESSIIPKKSMNKLGKIFIFWQNFYILTWIDSIL